MKHLFLFVFIVFLSCGETSQEQENTVPEQKDTLRYGMTQYTFSKPDAAIAEVLENWNFYQDFNDEATSLHQLDLEQLKIKTEKLLAHTDSLMTKVPDTLNTFSIKSRLAIIKTRTELLRLECQKNTIDAQKIDDYIEENNIAVNNFFVQIQEKLRKDGYDLQQIENEKKELEKQKRYLDSIRQLELQDQKPE
ncbi:hypothetical protein POV27_00145 [Aureisphaera galaxeae]|uniref:hypothetical protein n=1 Tax=Aureisphaera galaxeae TaxID=1538023 RepID=UPI002350B7E3|nr:hypothetical protein [Aureisphaera galaxeae]MDC8002446.1 hypothetical protein [Aureisphaera galaxeae]